MLKKCSLIVVLFIALTSCTQFTSNSSSKKPSDLFVLLSDYGQIQQASDGSWQLILNFQDMENVLVFSNRPYRLVDTRMVSDLQAAWSKGPSSFAKDPPNAAVIINQQAQTVVLKSLEVVQGQAIFTIQADGSQSLNSVVGETQLFIDDLSCLVPCLCPC